MNDIHILTTFQLALFATTWLLVGIAAYIAVSGIRAELRAKREAEGQRPETEIITFDETVAWAREQKDGQATTA